MPLNTKKALGESLKKLLINSNLDEITIKELSKECGVNRQTFYYHFHDIYSLVKWIFKSEAVEPIKNLINYENWQDAYLKIFEFVGENKVFCKSCMNSSGREYLNQFLSHITNDLLIAVINDVAKEKNISDFTKKITANFYSYGLTGIILSWIRDGFIEEPKVLVKEVNNLVEGDIKKIIEKHLNEKK
ncbi:TetR family transcriptional regulator [Hypnocyclicus thermotrophus]|uniref:TetR family transcriptional regulator n=1 Tax=Hypnocyclicus thermotrophus TaxID=1627895 RepID=A0AA46E0V7_9FUSO|nr:TetR/AcrR family transcriptional regulator [Hypnocyclicus thermotrophus]TDT72378.1 TetR family transcriptional regulator [Hypnocyclicus thermotrophus]